VLVDCLTLWLSNLLFAGGTRLPGRGRDRTAGTFHAERAALLAELAHRDRGDVVLVSNEVGMGIVPYGAVTRLFADEAGRLNQAVAACLRPRVFVAAGLPLVLKGKPC
jgi:adenosylcobinamide kinase/adenosylcobinamide-phosphate guanylyltransferase